MSRRAWMWAIPCGLVLWGIIIAIVLTITGNW